MPHLIKLLITLTLLSTPALSAPPCNELLTPINSGSFSDLIANSEGTYNRFTIHRCVPIVNLENYTQPGLQISGTQSYVIKVRLFPYTPPIYTKVERMRSFSRSGSKSDLGFRPDQSVSQICESFREEAALTKAFQYAPIPTQEFPVIKLMPDYQDGEVYCGKNKPGRPPIHFERKPIPADPHNAKRAMPISPN